MACQYGSLQTNNFGLFYVESMNLLIKNLCFCNILWNIETIKHRFIFEWFCPGVYRYPSCCNLHFTKRHSFWLCLVLLYLWCSSTRCSCKRMCFACDFCLTKGSYISQAVKTDAPLHSNEQLFNLNDNGQMRKALLFGILPMLSAVPPEYMHLSCIGVSKLLLQICCESPIAENNS